MSDLYQFVQPVPTGTLYRRPLDWHGCEITPPMWTLSRAMDSLYDGFWDRATRQAAVITLGRAVVALEREQAVLGNRPRYQN